MKLLPRDEEFFTLFQRQAEVLVRSAALFSEMIEHFDRKAEYGEKFRELEHEGDSVAHEIIEKLNRTFVTPLDREDIHTLAHRVDDIIDMVDGAVGKTLLYDIKKPTKEMKELSRIISAATAEIQQAIALLGNPKRRKELLDRLIEVNRLENEGDMLLKHAMVKLFENAQSTLEVIKWKEVYETVEKAIDKCEDLAVAIEAVVVKNA